MSYTLWYSCYIDLLRSTGVSVAFIEHQGKISVKYRYLTDVTINKLNLIAVSDGLSVIPRGSDIHVIGNSKYMNEVLHRMSKWIAKDEIDIKSHSDILKVLWNRMIMAGRMKSEYHTSRRAHPMLWSISKYSGYLFRICQLYAIQHGEFPRSDVLFEAEELEKENFLSEEYQKPLSDLAFEKLRIKERTKSSIMEDDDHPPMATIIPFQRKY